MSEPDTPNDDQHRPTTEDEVANLRAQLSDALERIAGLESALLSSRRIAMAVGIVMAGDKIHESDAFSRLVNASQLLNRKVRDIADEVVHIGRLP